MRPAKSVRDIWDSDNFARVFIRAFDFIVEEAYEVLRSLGWSPADCILETHGVETTLEHRRVLKVREQSVFEVKARPSRNTPRLTVVVGLWLVEPPTRSDHPYR